MPDDMTNIGGQDRARIAMGEDHEVAYWTDKLGVSRDELAKAVDEVGSSADAVAVYLGKAV
jgi:hypothetical protein